MITRKFFLQKAITLALTILLPYGCWPAQSGSLPHASTIKQEGVSTDPFDKEAFIQRDVYFAGFFNIFRGWRSFQSRVFHSIPSRSKTGHFFNGVIGLSISLYSLLYPSTLHAQNGNLTGPAVVSDAVRIDKSLLPEPFRHLEVKDQDDLEKLPLLERLRYIKVLQSEDFGVFYSYLYKHYKVSFDGNLKFLVQAYLEPVLHTRIRDQDNIKAFVLMHDYFPDVALNFESVQLPTTIVAANLHRRGDAFSDLKILMRTKEGRREYEQMLRAAATEIDEIKRIYHRPVAEPANDLTILAFPVSVREAMLGTNHGSIKGIDVYNYYRTTYPAIADPGMTIAQLGQFFQSRVMPILELEMLPSDVDLFLTQFGLNLSMNVDRIGFSQLYYQLKEAGLDTHTEGKLLVNALRTGSFANTLKMFNATYPAVRMAILRKDSEIANPKVLFVNLFDVWALSASIVKLKDFTDLSVALSAFNNTGPPLFNVSNADLKISILKAISRQGAGIAVSPFVINGGLQRQLFLQPYYDRQNLQSILGEIESGQALQLRIVLQQTWHLNQLELGSFIRAFHEPKLLEFLLNSQNALLYQAMLQQFPMGQRNLLGATAAQARLEEIVETGPFLVDSFRSGHLAVAMQVLARAIPQLRQPLPGTQLSVYPASIVQNAARSVSLNPEVLGDLNLLQRFGLTPMEMTQWLSQVDTQYLGKPEVLRLGMQNPQGPQRFMLLQSVLQQLNPSKPVNRMKLLFYCLSSNGNVADEMYALRQLENLGFDLSDSDTLDYTLRHILSEPRLIQAIQDDDFPSFYANTRLHLKVAANRIDDLPEVAQFFARSKQDHSFLKKLDSKNYQKFVFLVKKKWNLVDLDPAMMMTLLDIAQTTNPDTIERFLNKHRQENFTANDLSLIAMLVNEPLLEKRFNNRTQLLRQVWNEIYTRTPVTRSYVDEIENLRNEVKFLAARGKDVSSINLEIQRLQATYTERPDPAQLSNLDLLRLILVYEGLLTQTTGNELGQLLSLDLMDTSTEYGGVIRRISGRIHFEALKGLFMQSNMFTSGNESYAPPRLGYLGQGLAYFHDHISELDSTRYSGPSGQASLPTADLGLSAKSGSSWFVITSLGLQAPQTRPNERLLRINVDMYFVRNGKSTIVDLGVFTVPLSNYVPNSGPSSIPEPSPFFRSFRSILPALVGALTLGSLGIGMGHLQNAHSTLLHVPNMPMEAGGLLGIFILKITALTKRIIRRLNQSVNEARDEADNKSSFPYRYISRFEFYNQVLRTRA